MHFNLMKALWWKVSGWSYPFLHFSFWVGWTWLKASFKEMFVLSFKTFFTFSELEPKSDCNRFFENLKCALLSLLWGTYWAVFYAGSLVNWFIKLGGYFLSGALNTGAFNLSGINLSNCWRLLSIFDSSSSESANSFFIRAKFYGLIFMLLAMSPPLKKPKAGPLLS